MRTRLFSLLLLMTTVMTVGTIYAQDTWTVAGEKALLGFSRNPTATENDMTATDSVNFVLVKQGVMLAANEAGYAFKIAKNHSWDESYGYGGGTENALLPIAEDGEYTVTFRFDAANFEVSCEVIKTGDYTAPVISTVYTVAGASELCGTEWDPTDTTNNMTTADSIVYKRTKSDVPLNADSPYPFKIVKDHDWLESWPSENYIITVNQPGLYIVEITFDTSSYEISVATTRTGDYTFSDKVWTIAGVADLCGSEWDPTDTANDMTAIGNDIFKLVKYHLSLEAGKGYGYKVVANHSWTENYGADGASGVNNQILTVDADGAYTVTFTFNENTKELYAEATLAEAQEPYAVLSDSSSVLTFYYDDQITARNGLSVSWGDYDSNWSTMAPQLRQVVFDASFANCTSITSTQGWFYECANLETIEGLQYLNTARVTNMKDMFFGCTSLRQLDVSGFNTSDVTDMHAMFGNCEQLTTLDVSGFNTSKVTDMNYMFGGCKSLTTLDLRSFNTDRVQDTDRMFSLSTNLTTIYVRRDWTLPSLTLGENMFSECPSLVGGAGTAYDSTHVDHTYARIDGGAAAPGYFTQLLTMGDANGDGAVNIADAVATVSNILGEPAEGNFYSYAADMNNDEEIDIFDVTLIVNAALYADSPAPSAAGITRSSGNSMAAEAYSLTADGNGDGIFLDVDQAQRYTALQMDITLPEHAELTDVRLATATSHQLSFVRRGAGSYRVVVLSMSNETFRPTADGHLLQLSLTGTTSLQDVTTSDMLLVTPSANTITGISQPQIGTTTSRHTFYDLRGRNMGCDRQRLTKGVYLMNRQKVIVK